MKRCFLLATLLFALSPACSGQFFNSTRIDRVKNAPFSAEAQGWGVSRNSSERQTWTTEIGRASNGSTYHALFNPAADIEGNPESIVIHDAVSDCKIAFDPYRVDDTRTTDRGTVPKSARGMSINLWADTASTRPTRTLPDIRAGIVKLLEEIGRTPQTSDPDSGGEIHRTVLGKKVVDGFAIFGFREERTHDSTTGSIDERWESELGFCQSENRTNPTSGSSWGYQVTGLRVVEPPAKRFTLQERYLPRHAALADAKTLFLPDFPNHAELRQRVISILTASGRFTIVPSAKDADLTIRSNTSEFTGYGNNPPTHDFSMSFNEPGSHEQYLGDVLTIYLHLDSKTDGWAESPVVNKCFAEVWDRIEGLQAPSDSSSGKF